MLIPQFWAEGRLQDQASDKQVTVRRFGWSDESQANAQAMADTRAHEALQRLLRGEKLPRRDLKRPYNGSEGVPIREEIIARHGETVLTRNSYGAICLNTPNVLFADIDFDCITVFPWRIVVFVIAAIAVWLRLRSSWLFLALGILAIGLAYEAVRFLKVVRLKQAGGPEQHAKDRVVAFLSKHPDWHLRLYRTPAGLRVLAMHDLFDPTSPVVQEFFQALGVDSIFTRMCVRQQCFRARVSPKPWRIGITRHMRPATVWPIDPARLPERQQWIEEYERAARDYASCKFIEALGSSMVHPAVADVQQIHDELCQATRELPIA